MSNVASPRDEDCILYCPSQIQLTEIEGQWNSSALPRSSTGPQSLSVGFARDSPKYSLCLWVMQRLCHTAPPYTVSVLGREEGYMVKYTPSAEGVPEGKAQGNS